LLTLFLESASAAARVTGLQHILERKGVAASEKLKFLSVTGGVPKYLEEVDPSQTAEQKHRKAIFGPEASFS